MKKEYVSPKLEEIEALKEDFLSIIDILSWIIEDGDGEGWGDDSGGGSGGIVDDKGF